MTHHHDQEQAPRAAVPADVDAEDKIAYGLTARQLSILAIFGLAGYGAFQTLARWLPRPVEESIMDTVNGLADLGLRRDATRGAAA